MLRDEIRSSDTTWSSLKTKSLPAHSGRLLLRHPVLSYLVLECFLMLNSSFTDFVMFPYFEFRTCLCTSYFICNFKSKSLYMWSYFNVENWPSKSILLKIDTFWCHCSTGASVLTIREGHFSTNFHWKMTWRVIFQWGLFTTLHRQYLNQSPCALLAELFRLILVTGIFIHIGCI